MGQRSVSHVVVITNIIYNISLWNNQRNIQYAKIAKKQFFIT